LDTTYREMVLGDDLVPISRLSSAFLSPKSALHLQFAYYTSSLAVEFWIERFGQHGLDRLLEDLAIGMRQDEALARLPGSLQALDQDFLEFAKSRALRMAPETDFTAVDEAEGQGDASLSKTPKSYWKHRRALEKATQQEDWSTARRLADLLISLWPDDSSDDGVYWRLAKICRSTGDTNAEYQALTQLAQRAKAPREGLLRYVELATQSEQWETAFEVCELLQGIDPVSERVQEWRIQVSEHVSRSDKTLSALRALNAMDPVDPASVRYRMARASLALGQRSQAKRFCLQALEESPRFNDALELLLELKASDASP
jgi:tetratricopeptide (TPR) repeat protein